MRLEELLAIVTGKCLGDGQAMTLLNGDDIYLGPNQLMEIVNAALDRPSHAQGEKG